MPRLIAIDPATATGESKVLLDTVEKKLGVTPNLLGAALLGRRRKSHAASCNGKVSYREA